MSVHGGDIYRNHVDLDFSINVNPLGMPDAVRDALHRAVDRCSIYPDTEAERLTGAVSEMLGVPAKRLLFGNGASELFMAVIHAVMPNRTVIPVPSFYGYEYAAKAAGGEIVYYETGQDNAFGISDDIYNVLTEDVDLLFLANPNNPTGNLLRIRELKKLLKHCRDREIYVVLDECFIEFCGSRFSLLSEMKPDEFDNVILVRAFTKIFSIPGVRLGYLICSNGSLLARIKGQLPEWNLSCFAQEAGCICACQTDFIGKTQNYVRAERQFLEEGLRQCGCTVFPSAANFLLIYCGKQSDRKHSEYGKTLHDNSLYERLLRKGILIRDCSNFRGLGSGFYRIAVRTRRENERLLCCCPSMGQDWYGE